MKDVYHIIESNTRFPRQLLGAIESVAGFALSSVVNEVGARDPLAPIYDWFTEWFDAADLKEARALPSELS